jgi:hypothetical protein
VGKPRTKVRSKTSGKDMRNAGMRADGVREKSREAFLEGGGPEPQVMPEGGGVPVSDGNLRDITEGGDSRDNVFPDGRIKMVMVPEVLGI